VLSLSSGIIERTKSKRELAVQMKRKGGIVAHVLRAETEKECQEWVAVFNSFGMKIPERTKKAPLLSLKGMRSH